MGSLNFGLDELDGNQPVCVEIGIGLRFPQPQAV